MADVKISDLTVAGAVSGTMQFEVNNAGTSQSVTANLLDNYILGTTNGFIARTGTNARAARTLVAGDGVLVSNGDGTVGNPTIALDFADQPTAEAGTDTVKPLNSLGTAQAIAALASSFKVGDTLTTARDPGAGWVRASGQLLSSTSYPALAAALGGRFNPVRYDGTQPVKITNPATLPTGSGNEPAFSADNRFVAIAHDTSPFITIYDLSSGAPVKLDNPATLPAGSGRGVSWSPDGRYLAVAHATTPFVTIYDMQTGVPVKITNPAALPAGTGSSAAWSPDNRYLIIGHSTTPFVTTYDFSTGTPVKVNDPATVPTGIGNGVSWSKSGRYLAVAHATTPFLTLYDWNTGVPVKVANPATLPTGNAYDAAFSSNNRYLAVAHLTTPFLTIYDLASGTPVKIANPASLPGNTGYSVVWSPDGRYLVVGHEDPPYHSIYDWRSGVPVKISSSSILTNAGRGVDFSSDGRFTAFAQLTSSPYIIIADWAKAPSGGQFYLPKIAADPVPTFIKAA